MILKARFQNILGYLCNKRYISGGRKVVNLSHRSVIQVNGKDGAKLLQGLVTNDINHLSKEAPSMYSMLLNANGRVLYDLLFFKGFEENEYLVECEKSIEDDFILLMKKYKLRSKVNFVKRPDLHVHSLFNIQKTDISFELQHPSVNVVDPRIPELGLRILSDSLPKMEESDSNSPDVASLEDYNIHRFNLGVSEGVSELENQIPLEHNLAWLNGVSFNKGCYIGQELVARTHHVGVIRKRIMPVRFHCQLEEGLTDLKITNDKGKSVGKVIGYCGEVGIGLMRLKEVLGVDTQLEIQVKGISVGLTTIKPHWWPNI